MMIVDDDAAMDLALRPTADPHVRRLLALRRDKLGEDWHEAARFLVLEAPDTIADAEAAVGFPLRQDGEPTCEWAAEHEGVVELTWTLSDDGAAQVLVVSLRADFDVGLLTFVREAVEASGPVTDRA